MRKRSKMKLVSILLAITTMICLSSVTASAADVTPRISQYYLAEGVGAVDYFITSSASSYSTEIGNAANNWVYTGYGYNPIYMYQTTNFGASNMDIYAQLDGMSAGYSGATYYVDVRPEGHVHVAAEDSLWDYGEIYLNTSYTEQMASVHKQGVIAHEMGHVFGLAHNNDNPYSIMCQGAYGRVTETVGLADHYGINAMY